MEIIKDLRPCNKKYKFIHLGCCEFIAESHEFTWTCGQNNENIASVICPQCGRQFYYTPQEVTSQFSDWTNTTNCLKNCKDCTAKCLYRKEEFVSPTQAVYIR